MSAALHELGLLVQKVREQRGLTLEQLAERCGVSAATLSLLERGQGNPSFATLLRVATGLRVPIATFFQSDVRQDGIVVRAEHRKRLVVGQSEGRRYELLSPDVTGAIEMLWVRLEPGVWTEDEKVAHEGEECLVVLDGRLEAHIGQGPPHILEPGDSIYVRSEIPHSYRSSDDAPATFVIAITPPSF
ncbi:MAG: helix-turn-helix domain-containing protein [Armatimonadota bacterium]|nr:helix-turn-helix domain-containing protein [Armatimonadota bacterium]